MFLCLKSLVLCCHVFSRALQMALGDSQSLMVPRGFLGAVAPGLSILTWLDAPSPSSSPLSFSSARLSFPSHLSHLCTLRCFYCSSGFSSSFICLPENTRLFTAPSAFPRYCSCRRPRSSWENPSSSQLLVQLWVLLPGPMGSVTLLLSLALVTNLFPGAPHLCPASPHCFQRGQRCHWSCASCGSWSLADLKS